MLKGFRTEGLRGSRWDLDTKFRGSILLRLLVMKVEDLTNINNNATDDIFVIGNENPPDLMSDDRVSILSTLVAPQLHLKPTQINWFGGSIFSLSFSEKPD